MDIVKFADQNPAKSMVNMKKKKSKKRFRLTKEEKSLKLTPSEKAYLKRHPKFRKYLKSMK